MIRQAGELSIAEAARAYGFTGASLRTAVARGQLRAERRLGRVFLAEAELQEFIRHRSR
jgi:hypothetical protein